MRVAGWEQRLDRYLAANARRPFGWGDWDCCLFVCGAIEAMTGVDPAVAFRGQYANRKEARLALRERCGTANFREAFRRLAAACGFREVSPTFAGRGDLVLLEGGGRNFLGMVALDGTNAVVVAEGGLRFVEMKRAVRAWRV